MRTLLLASSAVLLLSQAALAQTPNNSFNSSTNPTIASQQMQSDLKAMLERSGYKDVLVASASFVIHAKDVDGNPVVFSITPGSLTEVTDLNATNGAAAGLAINNSGPSGQFVSVPSDNALSSKVVGLDIYNETKQDIGQIKDITMNQSGRAQAYIVSVGGFLGLAEHYVAVSPAAVRVSYDESDKKWHASMNASAEQLKAAPEFKYAGRWEASRM